MIIEMYRDYNSSDLSIFAEQFPLRYGQLCEIVGEYALGMIRIYLGVTLPFEGDMGCVVAQTIKDGIRNVVGVKYF